MNKQISRRSFLAANLALAFSPLAFSNEKTLVYKDWTQDQLNDQINQTSYLPGNMKELMADFGASSAKLRAELAPKTFSYGPSQNEQLDVYAPANAKDLPVMIFIHGGAWNFGSKDSYAGLSPTFVNKDAIYIAIGFDNIPPNNMPGIVNQCRQALAWVWKNAKQIGADPSKIYVSGHSSGGHMANMMLCTSWKKFGLPSDLLKGGVIMSGWSDLYPISLSDRQAYLKLTASQVQEYSPINCLKNVNCPVIISWGALESPYMQMQSAAWAKKLQSISRLAGVYCVSGHNHIEMPGLLADKNSELSKATLALMDLV